MLINSTDSDVFYVEESSNDPNVPKANTPIVLNSREMSGNDTREMISISSNASPGPHFVPVDSDSNEPRMTHEFGQQLPVIPPSLNDPNVPPNQFNILAPMVVVNPKEDGHDENYSPQSPKPSEPSPISTPSRTSAQLMDGRRVTRRRKITTSTPVMKPAELFFSRHALRHHRHHRAR